MISWWWLVIEFCVLALLGAGFRGRARALAIWDTLQDPAKAKAELDRRWAR